LRQGRYRHSRCKKGSNTFKSIQIVKEEAMLLIMKLILQNLICLTYISDVIRDWLHSVTSLLIKYVAYFTKVIQFCSLINDHKQHYCTSFSEFYSNKIEHTVTFTLKNEAHTLFLAKVYCKSWCQPCLSRSFRSKFISTIRSPWLAECSQKPVFIHFFSP
jgi:hypothetical protein